jgi:WD40 repeat protein
MVTAALMTVVAAVALWFWLHAAPLEPRVVVRFSNTLPVANVEGNVAVSRDGLRVAFVGGPQQQIYVRMLDQLEVRPMAGTEGAGGLSFSPDGQWISFISSGRTRETGRASPQDRLKKIALTGGPPQTLAEAPSDPRVQNWGEDDNILFNANNELRRVSSNGGQVQTLWTPDREKSEIIDGVQLLPGGRAILLSISTGPIVQRVVALNPQTGQRKTPLEGVGVGHYTPDRPGSATGYIIFYDSDTGALMAVPFDAARLEVKGSPVPVHEGVRSITGPFGSFASSESGTLAYVPGEALENAGRTMVWVDRKGGEQPLSLPKRRYNNPMLSPDGERAVVAIQEMGRVDVWVYDLARGAPTRITFENFNNLPHWAPDGKRVI